MPKYNLVALLQSSYFSPTCKRARGRAGAGEATCWLQLVLVPEESEQLQTVLPKLNFIVKGLSDLSDCVTGDENAAFEFLKSTSWFAFNEIPFKIDFPHSNYIQQHSS